MLENASAKINCCNAFFWMNKNPAFFQAILNFWFDFYRALITFVKDAFLEVFNRKLKGRFCHQQIFFTTIKCFLEICLNFFEFKLSEYSTVWNYFCLFSAQHLRYLRVCPILRLILRSKVRVWALTWKSSYDLVIVLLGLIDTSRSGWLFTNVYRHLLWKTI